VTFPRHAAVLAAVAGAFVAPSAFAAVAQIDSFVASASSVQVGGTLDFTINWSVATDAPYISGGSNPYEPAPVEGYQEWYVNWYSNYSESVDEISLNAAGQSYSTYVGVPAGSSGSGSWNFSITFDTPGTVTLPAGGSWLGTVNSYSSNEWATRDCWYNDPDNPVDLQCSSWSWQYSDYSDYYTTGYDIASVSISVDVVPVPELGTWANMLAALVPGVALRRWRRRGPAA
jgi:hypothetical protein